MKNITHKGLYFIVIIILILFASFVIATITSVTVNLPTTGQNVSGTITINATTVGTTVVNVTFAWINSSAGTAHTAVIFNDTASDSDFTNTSFDTTILLDGIFNLTVTATNSSGTSVSNTSVTGVTVDNTPPNVVSINTPTSTANLSTGTQIFNATINDTTLTVATVRFNITNGSGSVMLIASNPGGDFWNASVDLSTLAEETHTVTVLTNDTVGNQNNSESINFVVDRTVPTVATFNTPTSGTYHNTSFILNVTVNDTLSNLSSVQYRFENGTNSSQIIVAYTSMSNPNGDFWNTTINVTAIPDWNYTIRINATDYSGNSNTTEVIMIGIDDTNPSVSLSCNDIYIHGAQSCTCTGTDNLEALGRTVTTSTTSADTSNTGTKSVTCTATDQTGNVGSASTTYSVSQEPGGGVITTDPSNGDGGPSVPSESCNDGIDNDLDDLTDCDDSDCATDEACIVSEVEEEVEEAPTPPSLPEEVEEEEITTPSSEQVQPTQSLPEEVEEEEAPPQGYVGGVAGFFGETPGGNIIPILLAVIIVAIGVVIYWQKRKTQ